MYSPHNASPATNYFRIQRDRTTGMDLDEVFPFNGNDERAACEAWQLVERARARFPGVARVVAWRRPPVPGPWSSGALYLVGDLKPSVRDEWGCGAASAAISRAALQNGVAHPTSPTLS